MTSSHCSLHRYTLVSKTLPLHLVEVVDVAVNLHVQFHNEEFAEMLAYLADVFGHLKDMNLSLQGHDVTVREVKDKLGGLAA